MSATFEQHLHQLVSNGHGNLLTQLQHGIEKEGLRLDGHGHLSQTPHPKGLGSALTHSEITTDYSEALLEFITPVFHNPEEMIRHLEDLHRFSYGVLADEVIWGGSMPCHIPSEDSIPVAEYGHSNIGKMKHIYRLGLQHRYGKMMQTIAGIHYNVSLPEQLWPVYQKMCQFEGSMSDFRSASYFKLIRNFRRHSWLLLYLFGASPALSQSFLKGKAHQLDTLTDDTLYLPYATSLRMSDLGYTNKAQSSLNICFNHLQSYTDSLREAIRTPHAAYEAIGVKVDGQYRQLNANILQIENEYYSDIRPKRVAESGEKPIHALITKGVQYIEVRNTDINPLIPMGISTEQAYFLDAFLVTCLLSENDELSAKECETIAQNHQRIVTRGRAPGLTLLCDEGEVEREQLAEKLLDKIAKTAAVMDEANGFSHHSYAVEQQRRSVQDPDLTPSAQVLEQLSASKLSYHDWMLQLSLKHKATLSQTPLDAVIQSRLDNEAITSLQEQASIEANTSVDFDTFLADYHARN